MGLEKFRDKKNKDSDYVNTSIVAHENSRGMFFHTWDSGEEIFLSDCPFCGSEPEVSHIGNNHTKKRTIEIKCKGCNVKMRNSAMKNNFSWLESVSVKKWNNRVLI